MLDKIIMNFTSNRVTINHHGIEIITVERFDKPYYLLTYNAGSGNIYKIGVDDLDGVDPENLTAADVLKLMNKEY